MKTEKEKRFDEMTDIIKTSKNYRKIKDLPNTLSGRNLRMLLDRNSPKLKPFVSYFISTHSI